MRESNFRSPSTNRAGVTITPTLYDRRALDCTSIRPLISSLNHLAHLTSGAARVRETICCDGGLERLIAILKDCHSPVNFEDGKCTDSLCQACRTPSTRAFPDASQPACTSEALVGWKWSLALQCLLFLGTRGTESIRSRVVDAGAIPVIATILDNYDYMCQKGIRNFSKPAPKSTSQDSSSIDSEDMDDVDAATLDFTQTTASLENSIATVASVNNNSVSEHNQRMSTVMSRAEQYVTQRLGDLQSINADLDLANSASANGGTVPTETPNEPQNAFLNMNMNMMPGLNANANAAAAVAAAAQTAPRKFENGVLVPREDDVIWALEILAFASKYVYLKPMLQATNYVPALSLRPKDCPPILRSDLMDEMQVECRHDYDDYDFENTTDYHEEAKTEMLNIFPLVEKFTELKTPNDIPYWAGIIMRNSCRKDEHKGGIRQCANFQCAKWEEYPRQFAKCRRCKRSKYCSKECQLAAWSFHRHWCAPAGSSATTASVSTTASTTASVSSAASTTAGGHAQHTQTHTQGHNHNHQQPYSHAPRQNSAGRQGRVPSGNDSGRSETESDGQFERVITGLAAAGADLARDLAREQATNRTPATADGYNSDLERPQSAGSAVDLLQRGNMGLGLVTPTNTTFERQRLPAMQQGAQQGQQSPQ